MSRRAALAGGVLVILAVALDTAANPERAPVTVALGAFVLAAGILAERFLLLAVSAALAITLALPDTLVHVVSTSPVRIFGADLVVLPLLLAGALRAAARGRLPRLGLHMVVIVVAGAAWTALGIHRGHAMLDAVGTFRRLAVYPAVFLAAAAAFEDRRFPTRALSRIILAAAGVVALVALVRLLLGYGYMHAYFARAGTPQRFISFVEAFSPILAFNVLIGEVIARERGRAWRLVAMLVFVVVLAASNYRGVWLAFALSAVVWVMITRQPPRRYLKLAGVLGGLAALAVVTMVLVVPRGSLPTAKFSAANLRQGTSWRMGSWRRASEVFLHHPLAGVGFGYRHVFQYQTGPNLSEVRTVVGKTIHNDLLWLLVNFGLLGALLVIGFHVRWWYRTATFAGEDEGRTGRGRLAAAILATDIAIVTVAMMQPVFDYPSAVIAVYLLMGVAQGAAEEPARAPAVVVHLEEVSPG